MDYNPNFASPNTGSFSPLWGVLIIVFVIFIILVIYHETVGYYIDYGWKNVMRLITGKKEVEVEIGMDDEPTMVQTILKPFDPPKAEDVIAEEKEKEKEMNKAIIHNNLKKMNTPEEQIPLSFLTPPPPAAPSPSATSFFPNEDLSKTVYNVSQNIYTFYDAPAVCKALNGTLATYDQVVTAHKEGADWCNYGWIQGQKAVYPTQKRTWEKLQKGSPTLAKSCGQPGVNGGHFDNPELRFGVNCYGIRPPKTALDENTVNLVELPETADDIEFDKKVNHFRDNINSITVLPFHRSD